jgi:aminobenzoyl-glutamate utilization protein B
MKLTALSLVLVAAGPAAFAAEFTELQTELLGLVEARKKLSQEIADSVFSFAEVGFHETRTMEYLTGLLEAEGFSIETGVGGMPTAWVATWGSEGPFISFNSDVDGLPGQSQMPGVLARQPMVEGGSGHGEGHNTGIAVSVVAAIALKDLLEQEGLSARLQVWPGIAEEALAAKQWYVAAGVLDDVDAVLSNHVSSELGTSWGATNTMALISAEYGFEGASAHAAMAPWAGRSALDAVELMDAGWNFRREHLDPNQRSHSVITGGGLQPNIVPDEATVWYYFRHPTAEGVQQMFAIADDIAEGATLMTGTSYARRILGSAWPHHGNKVLAETMDRYVQAIGTPGWSQDDQAYAEAVQTAIGEEEVGLPTEPEPLAGPVERPGAGPSDDIGAVMWTVPTVRLSYPANIEGTTFHNWEAALAVATPIAHKGVFAGAQITALTALELITDPELLVEAQAYFDEVQTKEVKYFAFEGPDDRPAIHLNAETDERFRPQQEAFYYDPSRYETYLEQLGIAYPQLQ